MRKVLKRILKDMIQAKVAMEALAGNLGPEISDGKKKEFGETVQLVDKIINNIQSLIKY